MPAKNQVPDGNILSIDIGGTNIKACILDPHGKALTDFKKTPTPKKSTPENVLAAIKELCTSYDSVGKISIGFPGYVKYGVVQTAPNLAENKWANVDLAQQVANLFEKPVRLINDADQQGLGIVSGEGFEIVFTLGTGFGTALLFDGELLPHLELAHLPIEKDEDYDDFIGDRGFHKVGKKKWNKRLKYIIEIYKTVFNYDKLYIGGGNANEINFDLDDNITLVSNKDGIKGGAKLWLAKEKYHIHTTYPEKNNENQVAFLDIGGVLLSDGWNHKSRMHAVEVFGLEPIQFQKDHAVAFPLFENGKLTLSQYLDTVIFNEERSFSKEEFRNFMFSKSTQLPDFLPWLIEWKKETNMKIFSINNEGKEFNDHRIQHFRLHDVFDAFISSCEVGFSKPDPAIFKLALGIAQEQPQHCLYFDDQGIHVAMAKELGINAHLHKNFEQSKLILEGINR